MFHVTNRRFIVLSESQGGFRRADALVSSLVNVLTMRASTRTCVAFVDIEMAFRHFVGGSDAGPIA